MDRPTSLLLTVSVGNKSTDWPRKRLKMGINLEEAAQALIQGAAESQTPQPAQPEPQPLPPAADMTRPATKRQREEEPQSSDAGAKDGYVHAPDCPIHAGRSVWCTDGRGGFHQLDRDQKNYYYENCNSRPGRGLYGGSCGRRKDPMHDGPAKRCGSALARKQMGIKTCFIEGQRGSRQVSVVTDPNHLAQLAESCCKPQCARCGYGLWEDEKPELVQCPTCGELFCDVQCSRRWPCPHLADLGDVSCQVTRGEVMNGLGCQCECCARLLPPYCDECDALDCCDNWRSMYGFARQEWCSLPNGGGGLDQSSMKPIGERGSSWWCHSKLC